MDYPNNLLTMGANDDRLDYIIIALSRGADINMGEGETLMTSSKKGYASIVKYLLNNGIDKIYINGAIVRASMNGHLDVIKHLVEHVVDADDIYDLLMISIQYGHLDLVKYFVEHGANPRKENDYAVKLANHNGYNQPGDIVDYLVSKGSPDPRINQN